MLNQLAKEFKGELNCIDDNMEKYITFSVPIKKEVNDGKKNKILNLKLVIMLESQNIKTFLLNYSL